MEMFGEDADEVLWGAGLSSLAIAVEQAREPRWRSYPEGELRRLQEASVRSFRLLERSVQLHTARGLYYKSLTAGTDALAEDLIGRAAQAAERMRQP